MDSQSPLVSVILPSYCHAQYIEQAVLSVVSQTYGNIELIVIDDGSSDASAEILAAMSKEFGFYFSGQENIGLSRTLNRGLALAHGKYVCTFGSDDIMLLDKTAKQVRFMEENPDVSVCGGNALLIDSAGQILDERQRFPAYREITFESLFAEKRPGIYASSAMIRKDVLDREGGWDPEIPLEDMYMWYKLLSRGCRMVGLNDVLIYYRKHKGNSTKKVRYMYESMTKSIEPYKDHPLYEDVHLRHLRRYFLSAAKHDKALAREILHQIPFTAFNVKVLRGLAYLLLR